MRRTIAIICPKHGFSASAVCPGCDSEASKDTVHINTFDWVKRGDWEHIDPKIPNMRFNSKRELIEACEKRGLMPRVLMKPKSQGHGFEINHKGYF
jgi:hypothetical protein